MKTGPDLDVRLTIPLSAVSVAAPLPELLTQENVAAITGMPPERYLETVRAPGFPIQVSKLGRLRFVVREEFVAWIRAGAALATQATDEAAREAALAQRVGVEPRRKGGR